MQENPEKQAAEIIDCIKQASRPIGILIGAGCPFAVKGTDSSPLIPDTGQLSEKVVDALSNSNKRESWLKLFGQFEREGTRDPNLEDFLSRARGLQQYARGETVMGLSLGELRDIEDEICRTVVDAVSVDLPAETNPFQQLAVWIKSADRSTPVELFTTNYDLLIEQGLERHRVPYFDGFVGSYEPFFDSESLDSDVLPPRWSRLWKIHGSINWHREEINGELKIWRGESGVGAMIHASEFKYKESRKMPYLAMMDRLKNFLKGDSSVLLTVGYSFRDEHINEVIIQGLRGNPRTITFGLLHGSLANYGGAVAMANLCPNLRLQAVDGAIVGTRQVSWILPETKPATQLPPDVVRWEPVEGEGKWRPQFLLGDFERFGRLLERVAGLRDSSEASDA